MSNIHATEPAAADFTAAGANPETFTGTIDETRAAAADRPQEQSAALSMEALWQLHPDSWVPVWSDPQLAAEAEELALQIVGEDSFADVLALAGDTAARAELLALARNVAEPQVGWRRVWRVEHELEKSLPRRDFLGQPPSFVTLLTAATLQPRKPAAQVILAIYRYRQRLDVQRRKANRAFDAAVRRHQRRVFRLTNRLQRRIDKRSNGANAA